MASCVNIPEDVHKTIVHAVVEQLGFNYAISYEIADDGKIHACYGIGIDPKVSSYYGGRLPHLDKVFDVAIKEAKTQIIHDPHTDPRSHQEKITLHGGQPFAVIPVKLNDKINLLISVNNTDRDKPLHIDDIDKIVQFIQDNIAPQRTGKESLLDKKVSDYVDEIEKVQIGTILRSTQELKINNFEQKALLAYLTIKAQNKKGIFPYNRFLKNGSQTQSIVVSPDDKHEENCIVWCNNHYLALNRHPQVLDYAREALVEYGSGCGTSAASGGFSTIHKTLEQELANFTGKEEAVLYPTGFTTNTGVIGTAITKGDLIIVDRDSHASMIDGMRMSGADFRILRHLDVNHLESILKKIDRTKYNNIFVLTESVFSMSGEEAPLKEYCELKKKYTFYLYVDEAHAFGFYGEKGAGLCEHTGESENVDFVMSTLSKSTASVGGFVGAAKHICSYLRINSNPFLFQACLTPMDAAVCVAALKIIQTDRAHKEKLWKNTYKFRETLISKGFSVGQSRSPIVPVYVKDEAKLALFCRELYQNGIFTNWISYPAVRKNTGRLRFVVTAGHTDEQIERTIFLLEKIGRRMGVI